MTALGVFALVGGRKTPQVQVAEGDKYEREKATKCAKCLLCACWIWVQHWDAHYNGNGIYITLDYHGILQLALTVYMYYVGAWKVPFWLMAFPGEIRFQYQYQYDGSR